MKKSFKLENLCCANCAARIEDKLNNIDGINASLGFMTQRLTLEAEDMDYALMKAEAIIKKIEPDCKIVK